MKDYNIVIIGSGPAGLCAAIEASKYSNKILILDENINPGGQLVKQTHMFFGNNEYFAGFRGIEIAKLLIDKIRSNNDIELLQEATVIGIYENNEILYSLNKKLFRITSKSIIIATGASEKILAFPGSDLPGVYGAGAVQTLMNEYLVKPGQNVLMVGAGNIGLIVSYQMLQAGISVKGIIEAGPKVGGYIVHANKVKRHGIPIKLRHTIKNAFGNGKVEYATICQVDDKFQPIKGTDEVIKVDTICIATGLTPISDLVKQADIETKFAHFLGGNIAIHNKFLQTNNESVFIAGDVSGIEEATTAMIEGKISALSCCKYLKEINIISNDIKKEIDKKHNKYFKDLDMMRNNPFGYKTIKGKESIFETKEYEIANKTYSKPVDINIEKLKKSNKLTPIVECFQNIPCNPCITSCKFEAITMEDKDIASLPNLNYDKCISCLNCAKVCPGLSIFFINYNFSETTSNVVVPYELYPLPEVGEIVNAVDKNCNTLCDAKVLKIIKSKNPNNVTLVSLETEKENSIDIRSFTLKVKVEKNNIKDIENLKIDKDVLICRCEDITHNEIIDKIQNEGLECFNEIKRVLRCGMGPCQGKNCHDNIQRILAMQLNRKMEELETHTYRKPAKPISMKSIADLYINTKI